jgi:hypothetical protein
MVAGDGAHENLPLRTRSAGDGSQGARQDRRFVFGETPRRMARDPECRQLAKSPVLCDDEFETLRHWTIHFRPAAQAAEGCYFPNRLIPSRYLKQPLTSQTGAILELRAAAKGIRDGADR